MNNETRTETSTTPSHRLLLVGEGLHVMNPALVRAIEERDEQRLVGMARSQVEAGADALDLNLGQSRQLCRLIPWLVELIQDEMETTFFLSSHVLKMEQALKAHQGRATINAVTADEAGLTGAMEKAMAFDANLVVLLVSPDLTPGNVDERLQLAARVIETAVRVGMPLSRLYLDPVISCRPDPMTWHLGGGLPDMETILESIRLIGELSDHAVRTIVALSNASACLPRGQRSDLHCRLLPMLVEVGLDAVILNCSDSRLMAVARNPARALQVAA